jgi:hypothetical protein
MYTYVYNDMYVSYHDIYHIMICIYIYTHIHIVNKYVNIPTFLETLTTKRSRTFQFQFLIG